jgi:hypothetical protein
MQLDKTAAIAIMARDCEKALERNIPKVEKLRTFFKSSLVVIVENDSIDKTKSIIQNWADNYENIVILSKDYNTQTIPPKTSECLFPGASRYRMEKMCKYRNEYMDYLRSCDTIWDYLIIIDIDIDDFSIDGIIDSLLRAPDDWTALFANGKKYIPFILRIPICYYDGYPLVLEHGNEKIALELTHKEIQKAVDIVSSHLGTKEFIKCVSAFGGIGIYKYKYIKDSRYSTIPNTRSKIIESLCDHVSMNYPLYKKNPGTLYISKKMKVYYKRVSSIKDLISKLPFSWRVFLYEMLKKKAFPS